MPSPPLNPAAERFARLVMWLVHAVAKMSGGDRLSYSFIALIVTRLRDIKLRVTQIAEQLAAGTFRPRKPSSSPRKKPESKKPRTAKKLPCRAAWLLRLVADAAGSRSQLEYLFRDPEMMALIAAAPEALGRPLRSLCWMLGCPPPDIIAPAKRERPPRVKKPRPKKEPLPPYWGSSPPGWRWPEQPPHTRQRFPGDGRPKRQRKA